MISVFYVVTKKSIIINVINVLLIKILGIYFLF
jgi:hypothetical protein